MEEDIEDIKEIENKMINILFLGDPNVGKYFIISYYTEGKIIKDYEPGTDIFVKKDVKVKDKNVIVELWSFGGTEIAKFKAKGILETIEGCFIVYDITNEKSFNNLDFWFDIVKNKDIPIFLLGNKTNLEKRRKVIKERGEEWAKGKKM